MKAHIVYFTKTGKVEEDNQDGYFESCGSDFELDSNKVHELLIKYNFNVIFYHALYGKIFLEAHDENDDITHVLAFTEQSPEEAKTVAEIYSDYWSYSEISPFYAYDLVSKEEARRKSLQLKYKNN